MEPLRKMLLMRSEMYTYNIQMSVAIKIAKGMKIAHTVHLTYIRQLTSYEMRFSTVNTG